MLPSDLVDLRKKAIAAIPGAPLDADLSTGEWEPWYSFHGDPYVVEKGRGQFGHVATIGKAPEDYGRARAEFMGATDPTTVMALLDEIDSLKAAFVAAYAYIHGGSDRGADSQARYTAWLDARNAVDSWAAPSSPDVSRDADAPPDPTLGPSCGGENP